MSGYTFDDVQHAYQTGYDAGRMARVELEAEQRAHALIHERAVEMLGLARREATERHGPAWAAMVLESASAPWEVDHG